jgi:hypothetical protein
VNAFLSDNIFTKFMIDNITIPMHITLPSALQPSPLEAFFLENLAKVLQ